MLAMLFEEPTDELNDLEPIDRQPPADMVQLLGSLFAGALGLEAEPGLEADVAFPGEPDEGEGCREMGAKLPPMSD